MIKKFFEVKIRYEKITESGKAKMVNETYLVDAVNFSDTETSIHKEMEPYITGEFEVIQEKISNISELIPNENGDRWFNCKVVFISIDEEKGIEKKSKTLVLAQANTVREAYENVELALADYLGEFEIPSVSDSNIMDVFVRDAEKELIETCKTFTKDVLENK